MTAAIHILAACRQKSLHAVETSRCLRALLLRRYRVSCFAACLLLSLHYLPHPHTLSLFLSLSYTHTIIYLSPVLSLPSFSLLSFLIPVCFPLFHSDIHLFFLDCLFHLHISLSFHVFWMSKTVGLSLYACIRKHVFHGEDVILRQDKPDEVDLRSRIS